MMARSAALFVEVVDPEGQGTALLAAPEMREPESPAPPEPQPEIPKLPEPELETPAKPKRKRRPKKEPVLA
jgi:hypothetical protein